MRFSLTLLLLVCCACSTWAARGGRGRGKGKGKNLLPFGNIAEYSLVKEPDGLSPGVSSLLSTLPG